MKNQITLAAVLSVALLLLSAGSLQAALVGYWSFDADTAADDSGNSNNGTLVGGTAGFSSDTPPHLAGGRSLNMLAASDYVTVPGGSSTLNATSIDDNLTVVFWMKATDGGGSDGFTRLVAKQGGGGDWNFEGSSPNTGLRIGTDEGSGIVNKGVNGGLNTTPVFTGDWVQVAMTLSGTQGIPGAGTLVGYKNGITTGNSVYNHGLGIGNSAILVFGAQNGGGAGLLGMMDDIQIWNETLSAGKIKSLTEPILSYDPTQMETLFEVFDDTGSSTAFVEDLEWSYITGLALGNGNDSSIASGLTETFFLQLDTLGNGVTASVTLPVPEPSSLVLLGIGVVGLATRRRRRRALAASQATS